MTGYTQVSKLLAAGCIVGLLGAAGVVADADAPMPETTEPDMDMDADPLEALGYKSMPDMDYVPGTTGTAANLAKSMVTSIEACAEACEADAGCNAATYFSEGDEPGDGTNNCFLKVIDPGCVFPDPLEPKDGATFMISENRCTLPVPAIAPATDAMFEQYDGFDYSPAEAAGQSVTVENLPEPGHSVTDVDACEDLCAATAGCNAASFYITPVSGNNCWLKTISDTCGRPAGAKLDTNAIFLIKVDPTCASQAPVAVSPAEAPTSVVDPTATGSPAGETGAPGTVDTTDRSSAGTLYAALVAFAAMAAAVL